MRDYDWSGLALILLPWAVFLALVVGIIIAAWSAVPA